MVSINEYRGRFAPTPSGPLHLGSLLTATASYLQARRAGGAWLLRIDDLDAARCPRGMDARILRQLEEHGLLWDESPRYQRRHLAEYREALDTLARHGLVYRCACTRAVLRASSRTGPDGAVYAGTCRCAAQQAGSARVLASGTVGFHDGWQGAQRRDLARDVGDFVVARADGTPAYQLACAVDESAQRITEVVRGADLLGSTFQQLWLMQQLALAAPAYRHLPVLTDPQGRKLSKQNHAAPVDGRHAARNLVQCLRLLGQAVPIGAENEAPAEILRGAVVAWDAARVPRSATMPGALAYNAVQQNSSVAP